MQTMPPNNPIQHIGFGDENADFVVYIDKLPPAEPWQYLQTIQPLDATEIDTINQYCGNGWRKVFNVYAKLLFAVDPQGYLSWQQLRQEHLLQANSNHALIVQNGQQFTPLTSANNRVQLIMGKTFGWRIAQQLQCDVQAVFAAAPAKPLSLTKHSTHDFCFAQFKQQEQCFIICPYFDYRQLTNQRITELVSIIKTHC